MAVSPFGGLVRVNFAFFLLEPLSLLLMAILSIHIYRLLARNDGVYLVQEPVLRLRALDNRLVNWFDGFLNRRSLTILVQNGSQVLNFPVLFALHLFNKIRFSTVAIASVAPAGIGRARLSFFFRRTIHRLGRLVLTSFLFATVLFVLDLSSNPIILLVVVSAVILVLPLLSSEIRFELSDLLDEIGLYVSDELIEHRPFKVVPCEVLLLLLGVYLGLLVCGIRNPQSSSVGLV